jgi:hypothetical protein
MTISSSKYVLEMPFIKRDYKIAYKPWQEVTFSRLPK